jgi:twitching motility protein PilT
MSEEAAPQDLVPVLGSVDDYLRFCAQYDASDLHLATGSQPVWRRFGNLGPIWNNATVLTPEDTRRLAHAFLDEAQIKRLEERGDVDFAYSPDFGRFRASVVRQRLGIDITFRIISTHTRSIDELNLPEMVRTLIRYQNGLVLVTGPVGCGKSTTLAALVDQINKEREDHIITLEEPIEYVLTPKSCHINQREVGTHTASFAAALRGALREDPDIIMVGEMRDLETISLAITAAETGHLVSGNAAYRKLGKNARSCAGRVPTRSARSDPHHGVGIPARHHFSATHSEERMAMAA